MFIHTLGHLDSIINHLSSTAICRPYLTCSHKTRPINGLFTSPDSDTDSNSDSDCKPNGYVVPCRTFSTAQSDSDSNPNYQTVGMGSESGSVLESGSVNVNKPLNGQTHELKMPSNARQFNFGKFVYHLGGRITIVLRLKHYSAC